MDWKEFQEITAQLFRQLGCEAETDKTIMGARAEHNIDVFVTFATYGITSKWVIECKFWNSNVPKEKVLTLKSVVEDVGADKGILITRKGYQKGAANASGFTNITLMTFNELYTILKKYLHGLYLPTTISQKAKSSNIFKDRQAIISSLKKPIEGTSPESYRLFLINSQDQQIQKAAISGLEKIGGQETVLLLTERLLNLWGLGAISRTIKSLSKLASNGSILSISATLLIDCRTYYAKFEALHKALSSLGDEEAAKIISSILAQQLNPDLDFHYKLAKIVHRDIERVSEATNEDLKHGVKIGCFFSNRCWAEMVQTPNYIDDSIEYAESRVPGLIATIQQVYLTRWS